MPGSKEIGAFCVVNGFCTHSGKSAEAYKSEGYKIITYEQAVKEIKASYGEDGQRL